MEANVKAHTQSWLPLILRGLLVLFLLGPIIFGLIPARFAAFGLVFAAAIGLGFAPRVTSAAVLIETVLRLQVQPSRVFDLVLIACGTGILFFGSGSYSLWKPEEDWIARRPGEKRLK